MAVIEGVAGKTGKQIEAAKRAQTKRLGQSGAAGMQKRCKKGKSCGATCINSSKVCLVDIPWATGSQITKVAKTIKERKKKPAEPTADDIKAKIREHHGKLKEATIAENGKDYTRHRKEILKNLKELKAKGEKVPDVPMPTWNKVAPVVKELKDANAKGDKEGERRASQKLRELFLGKKEGQSSRLTPLDSTEAFREKIKDTKTFKDNAKMVEGSLTVARILNFTNDAFPSNKELYSSPEEKSKFIALRNKIGKGVISDGYHALDQYTASYTNARLMRLAEIDPKNSSLSVNDRIRAESLGKLLALKEMPRPEVEKFRGFRATPDRLQEMIAGVNGKESFNHKTTYSWSASMDMGKDFADRKISQLPERTERVIFRTINKRGVPIEYVTSVEGESELLTPKNTKYRYLAYRQIGLLGENYHIFDVE